MEMHKTIYTCLSKHKTLPTAKIQKWVKITSHFNNLEPLFRPVFSKFAKMQKNLTRLKSDKNIQKI